MASFKVILFAGLLKCTQSQSSQSTDDFAAFSASLGGMDVVWVIYAGVALLSSLCCISRIGIWNKWCQSETYDAVNVETYGEILTKKGYDAEVKGLGDNRPLKLMVFRDDIKERRIWHDNWKMDFMIFIRNEHALFSTCYSHPHHPYSRKQRRAILASVLLLDFAIAIIITYALAFASISDDAAEFAVDYCISYVFGIIMTILESMLVSFAVCSGSEKCPTCIRGCCKAFGNTVICGALTWGAFAFLAAMIFMILVATKEGTSVFWQVFILNFFVGLIQAWFFIDLIKMAIQFRQIWKEAHPPPPGPEREAEEEKKRSAGYKCAKCLFYVFCCWLACLIHCCCKKKPKKDPYDDGQDDFGINYKEFAAWKNNEEIEERKLPKTYQTASMGTITHSAKNKVNKQINKVNDGMNNKVNDTKKELVDTANQTKQKVKSFGNKFKEKKMAMSLKLNAKRNNKQQSIQQDNTDEVELVVDQNNNDQIR